MSLIKFWPKNVLFEILYLNDVLNIDYRGSMNVFTCSIALTVLSFYWKVARNVLNFWFAVERTESRVLALMYYSVSWGKARGVNIKRQRDLKTAISGPSAPLSPIFSSFTLVYTCRMQNIRDFPFSWHFSMLVFKMVWIQDI